MSKDTINPKRWIFDETELNKLMQQAYDLGTQKTGKLPIIPNPMEIPSDEDIALEFKNNPFQQEDATGNLKPDLYANKCATTGAKWLRDLIFNLPNPSNK